jgi:hypothetical protein
MFNVAAGAPGWSRGANSSAEHAKDWGWTVAVRPDDFDGLAVKWQRIVASEKAGEGPSAPAQPRRRVSLVSLPRYPLRDEKGNIVMWRGVNTDIDDRRRVEAELTQAHFYLTEA